MSIKCRVFDSTCLISGVALVIVMSHPLPLFAVMTMYKESEGCSTQDHFVHIVMGAPESMTSLTFDWTLNDLERFCTRESHIILSVDPTFNLGAFDVTVTTYRHLILTNSSGGHPVMTGPPFIHLKICFLPLFLHHHWWD